jgi:hypothetical protein
MVGLKIIRRNVHRFVDLRLKTYDLRPQKCKYFCDSILFEICTSKIINKLIINQAAARTITMGASGKTGLPHTQAYNYKFKRL